MTDDIADTLLHHGFHVVYQDKTYIIGKRDPGALVLCLSEDDKKVLSDLLWSGWDIIWDYEHVVINEDEERFLQTTFIRLLTSWSGRPSLLLTGDWSWMLAIEAEGGTRSAYGLGVRPTTEGYLRAEFTIMRLPAWPEGQELATETAKRIRGYCDTMLLMENQ